MKKEADRKRRAEESKRQQEETRKNIEAAARQKQQHEEGQKRLIEEKSRLEREAIERQQRDSQEQMRLLQEAMVRQKEDALREMEQERRNRARREQLRKEHEEALAAPRPAKRPLAVAPPPKLPPVQRRRLTAGRPFEAEDDTDEAVLNEYTSRIPPDASLPAVPFFKRNGTYWLGQRRCNAVVEGGQVVVKIGSDTEHFISWLTKAERVEALKLKGLRSAQTVITLQQAIGSRSVAVPVKT